MFIPVTHSTQCVAEYAKCGFSGQAKRPWVHPRSSVFHRPIQYGRPNYITREPQGCCIQRLFDTLANHRTHDTRPQCHFDWRMGIRCAMVAERWVWTNEKPYFSYVEISGLLAYWHREFARKQISLRKRPWLVHVPYRRLSWTCGFKSGNFDFLLCSLKHGMTTLINFHANGSWDV